jgi:(1->4)-alpha-D-glucan 1-alpha-D-glucosylmutase
VQAHALALGMPVGLYVDLALGADRGGAEVWSDPQAYAMTVSTGAPPDEFNPKGQDWGLPPYSPRALRAKRFRPFAELLRANMPRGGALRIDHVMALMRLYWIPLGAKADRGGYVSYPLRELVAVLAEESRRNRCMVIGEDLGTVPPEVRDALSAAGVLSYRPLLFRAPAAGGISARRAGLRQHPRPADLARLLGGPRSQAARAHRPDRGRGKEKNQRKKDQASLAALLAREGLDTSVRSAHAFIARTPSKLAVVQPEDLFEALEQANLPARSTSIPTGAASCRCRSRSGRATRACASSARSSRPRRRRSPIRRRRRSLPTGCSCTRASGSAPRRGSCPTSRASASAMSTPRRSSRRGRAACTATTSPTRTRSTRRSAPSGISRNSRAPSNSRTVAGARRGAEPHGRARRAQPLVAGRAAARPRSRYAKFFDIDWRRGKVLLPVLGRHYGEALEAGEIRITAEVSGISTMSFP